VQSPLPLRLPIIVEDRRKSTAGKPRGKIIESASKNLFGSFSALSQYHRIGSVQRHSRGSLEAKANSVDCRRGASRCVEPTRRHRRGVEVLRVRRDISGPHPGVLAIHPDRAANRCCPRNGEVSTSTDVLQETSVALQSERYSDGLIWRQAVEAAQGQRRHCQQGEGPERFQVLLL